MANWRRVWKVQTTERLTMTNVHTYDTHRIMRFAIVVWIVAVFIEVGTLRRDQSANSNATQLTFSCNIISRSLSFYVQDVAWRNAKWRHLKIKKIIMFIEESASMFTERESSRRQSDETALIPSGGATGARCCCCTRWKGWHFFMFSWM